jgi:hypothetical protein
VAEQAEDRRGFWARVRGGLRRAWEAFDLLDGLVTIGRGLVLVVRVITWPFRILGRLFDDIF